MFASGKLLAKDACELKIDVAGGSSRPATASCSGRRFRETSKNIAPNASEIEAANSQQGHSERDPGAV